MLEFRAMSGESQDDADDLFELYRATPGYFQAVKGRGPSAEDAIEALTSVPPGDGNFEKVFGGYWLTDHLIGFSDIVFGYPDSVTAYLGLLLFREGMQFKGYGSWAHRELSEAATSKGCQRMRLSVIETNTRAAQFWFNKGYREVGIRRSESYTGDIIILEQRL